VNARGSQADPVIFAARDGSWNGFHLTGTPTDTSYFVNVRIEHAGQDWTDPAAILATGSHPAIIDSSHIFEPRGRGVWLGTAGSRITRSTITSSGWEWGGYYGARLDVATTFDSNTVIGASWSGGGVYVNAGDVAITNSEITDTQNHGVYVECCGRSNVTVHGSNLYNNGGDGVHNASGDTADLIDATNNWWGDADGPLGANGDGVTGNVTYSPYAATQFGITSPAPAPLAAIAVTPTSEPDEETR
jgi:hypothetical protein